MERPYATVILLHCFAHKSQWAVKKCLKFTLIIDALIGCIRKLIKKINYSPKLQEGLARIWIAIKSLHLENYNATKE